MHVQRSIQIEIFHPFYNNSVLEYLDMKVYLFKSSPQTTADDKFVKILIKASHIPVLVPVISFEFTNLDILIKEIKDSSSSDGIILSSPRCVESLERATDSISDQERKLIKSSWRSKKIFCVGPATAERAKKFFEEAPRTSSSELESESNDITILTSTDGNAESLAHLITNETLTLPLLYPCGNLKRDTISNALKTANIKTNLIVVYSTIQNPELENIIKTNVLNEPKDVLSVYVFFSPSGINFAANLLSGHLPSKYIVALGAVTKDAILKIESIDPTKVYQCEFPTEESLLKTISDIVERNGTSSLK